MRLCPKIAALLHSVHLFTLITGSIQRKYFLNDRKTMIAIRLTIHPYKKVIVGLIVSQSNPAIKLDGNAIRPVNVWYVPKAVDLRFSDDKSDTKAL